MPKQYLIPLIFLLATACDAPAPPNYPPIRFTDKSPIYLDVVSVEVHSEYEPSMRAPYVEHLFPVSPEQAMVNWAKDRLKTVGSEKTLLFIIHDARVLEEKLPKTTGLEGMFTDDQESKYTAQISVELKIYGNRAVSLASTEAHATRHATISEKASLVERDQLFYKLTKALMKDINAELEKNIQEYFSPHIHYSY